jgi:hypothetical protein
LMMFLSFIRPKMVTSFLKRATRSFRFNRFSAYPSPLAHFVRSVLSRKRERGKFSRERERE